MSKKTLYLLGILLTIILGTILYCYLCCSCCSLKACGDVKEKVEEVVVEPEIKKVEATRNAFALDDEKSGFKVNINDNFNFKTSDFSILKPISTNVESEVSRIKDFLDKNPLKTIDITGFFKSDEKNNSAYPNLGLARANAVKNYLVTHGISSKQIDTYGKLNESLIPDENETLFGPVTFGVLTGDANNTAASDALKAACDAIKANPLVLHFGSGQAAINLTPEQRQKIADISHCVDKLGAKVLVVGHTDNTGNANTNIGLGQKRADFAKRYLTRNGILEMNIETASKGQSQPIADNNTEAGRAENRRTVVTIN